MATEQNIDTFHKGENVGINFSAKNPDGTPLTSAASQAIKMTLAATDDDAPALEFTTVTGQIVLVDDPSALFKITLTPTDLTTLVEGRTYYYNVWSEDGAANRLVQAKGSFRLLRSIEPA